jgi:excisionase family DNA binding protein
MIAVATKTTIPGYIRLDQAAEIIGVDPATVWRYINENRLDALKIGNTHLIREADARNFEKPRRGRPPKEHGKQGENRDSKKSRHSA